MLLVSHDRALLDAVPDRIVAFEDGALRSYDGGWADLERERERRAAAGRSRSPTRSRSAQRLGRGRERSARRSELELLEARDRGRSRHAIAELERKLADDWTNMDVLSAHRAARDELSALLARWEVLFEEAHAT